MSSKITKAAKSVFNYVDDLTDRVSLWFHGEELADNWLHRRTDMFVLLFPLVFVGQGIIHTLNLLEDHQYGNTFEPSVFFFLVAGIAITAINAIIAPVFLIALVKRYKRVKAFESMKKAATK